MRTKIGRGRGGGSGGSGRRQRALGHAQCVEYRRDASAVTAAHRPRRKSRAACRSGLVSFVAVSRGDQTMRVMVIVKATKTSEAGILPGDPRAPPGFDTI